MKAKRKSSRPARRASSPTPAGRLIGGHYTIHSRWPVVVLSSVSILLFSLLFDPICWWPLAFVALVPWLTAICTSDRAGWTYLVSYLFGVVFLLINMRWLAPVTLPGYIALAFYYGILFPAISCPLRHFVRRRKAPVALVFPILWVATELPRATHTTGLPWFFLSQSMYSVLPMIQISDLVGAHGVSFVIAMVNGWVVDLIIQPILFLNRSQCMKIARIPVNTIAVLIVVGGTLIYGFWRLGQKTIHPGPLVAVIQQDFPSYVDPGQRRKAANASQIAKTYFAAVRDVLEKDQPDLVVLPESPWTMALNEEFLRSESQTDSGLRAWSRQCHELFSEYARQAGTFILTGGTSVEMFPTQVYPKEKLYNSAFLYAPDGKYPQRYDKVHLVLFGEYVPFRYGRLHFVYQWLNSITPWGRGGYEYSLTAGSGFRTFTMQAKSQGGQVYRFGTPICYEDVIPYCCRAFMTREDGEKGADFLLNISNDGWFNHSQELDQHLAICVFRAVENRVGIARAVNTGNSGFIDPNGRIYDRIPVGKAGSSIQTLFVDTRHSLYPRGGYLFSYVCALCAIIMLFDAVVIRRIYRLSAAQNLEERP